MSTIYAIATYGTIQAHKHCLRISTYAPLDSSHKPPFTDEMEMVIAINCATGENFLKVPGVIALPDPLRNTPVSPECAGKLASFGVRAGDTTFDVIDKLVLKHKGMQFKLK
jgi:hypothetical protein